MFIAFLASTIFTVSIIMPPAPVLQGRNSIEGRVTSPDRKALANLPVFLLNDAYGQKAQTYTDGSGRFYFRNLNTGN